jgi:serine/threonine protein kinase
MLTPEGAIRVIDFGLARPFARRTAGTAIGTPGYAPPEQYQGLAEPASDLYALGATMHHLLTGRDPRAHSPFQFPPVRSLAPQVSTAIAAVVDRSLVLDPRRRFDTAADMYRALHPDVPLESLPRLTVARAVTTTPQPAAPSGPDHAGLTVLINPAMPPTGGNVAALPADEHWLTFGGISLYVAPDWRSLALHNHTSDGLHCEIVSGVDWLQPVAPTTWLMPHGLVEITLSGSRSLVAGSGSLVAAGGGPSTFLSLPAPTPRTALPGAGSLPALLEPRVYLRVQSTGQESTPAGRLSVLPGLLPVSVLGALSFVATFIVVFFHLTLAHLYVLEVPALIIAIILQRRTRR